MSPELTSKLLAAYPLLYRDLPEWRFECGNGWFNLVWEMSAKIEATAALESLPKTSNFWPSISILKQKFGTLRVQFHGNVSDAMKAIVTQAYEQSHKICELCGETTHCGSDNQLEQWVETLCDKCRKAHRSPLRSQSGNKLPIWMREKGETE